MHLGPGSIRGLSQTRSNAKVDRPAELKEKRQTSDDLQKARCGRSLFKASHGNSFGHGGAPSQARMGFETCCQCASKYTRTSVNELEAEESRLKRIFALLTFNRAIIKNVLSAML